MATKRTELITKLIESAFQNKYMAGAENVWFRKFDLVNPVQPFMWGLDSEQVEFKTCNSWLVKPNKKNRVGQSKKIVLYFHGGGYVSGPVLFHWKFITDLSRYGKIPVLSLIYSKVPESFYPMQVNEALEAYEYLLKKYPEKEIIISGDSAGGNLALELYIKLKKDHKKLPKEILLISPWLDLKMDNPKLNILNKTEPVLNKERLIEAGKLFLKDYKQDLYKMIPELKQAKIMMITGTKDILYPDIKKFYTLSKKEELEINFKVYPDLFHDFSIFTTVIQEADIAFKEILEFLKES